MSDSVAGLDAGNETNKKNLGFNGAANRLTMNRQAQAQHWRNYSGDRAYTESKNDLRYGNFNRYSFRPDRVPLAAENGMLVYVPKNLASNLFGVSAQQLNDSIIQDHPDYTVERFMALATGAGLASQIFFNDNGELEVHHDAA